MKARLLGAACASLIAVVSQAADAALVSRLGGQAVYDTDLNITWITDANLAASNAFGTAGINAGGYMTWDTADTWIANMNADGGTGYLGFSDWRLPITPGPDASCDSQSSHVPPQGFGTGCTGSEMGHLYNVEGVTTAAPGLFSNVQPGVYWSGTDFMSDPTAAWNFKFSDGVQWADGKWIDVLFAWAVRPGDVSAVPVPAAVWLFGSGLLGLVGMARRKKEA